MIKKIKGLFNKPNTNRLVELYIDEFKLLAPVHHEVEKHIKQYKYYSRNLPRIARYIEEKYPIYNIVDVGANIGDSIALIRSAQVLQQIYAVEGDFEYYKILQSNTEQFNGVKLINSFLGEKSQTERLSMKTEQGTGKLISDENVIEIKKLDDLIKENNLNNIKLLKIDTDGFDIKILRGSFDAIKEFKPVLFFEYDASYLKEQNEDGLAIFDQLASLGYNRILYYDNFGKFLISITTKDNSLIEQLYAYIKKSEGAFPYYDLCIFHDQDEDLANLVIKAELNFFDN